MSEIDDLKAEIEALKNENKQLETSSSLYKARWHESLKTTWKETEPKRYATLLARLWDLDQIIGRKSEKASQMLKAGEYNNVHTEAYLFAMVRISNDLGKLIEAVIYSDENLIDLALKLDT